MPRLNAANNAESTLAIEVDSETTSFQVADASSFPSVPFRLSVDDEIVEVSSMNGNVFTVERGLEGTVSTVHDSGVKVENRFTAGAYGELADKEEFDGLNGKVDNHIDDKDSHITPSERQLWNGANYYTDTKVAEIVNSAPSTLDTLNELSTALGNDPNFATTVTNQIALSRTDSAKAFSVEVRTSDPVSPTVGQMWLRSDL